MKNIVEKVIRERNNNKEKYVSLQLIDETGYQYTLQVSEENASQSKIQMFRTLAVS